MTNILVLLDYFPETQEKRDQKWRGENEKEVKVGVQHEIEKVQRKRRKGGMEKDQRCHREGEGSMKFEGEMDQIKRILGKGVEHWHERKKVNSRMKVVGKGGGE